LGDHVDDVLILGNGISRLTYDRFIKEWLGELWGCNSIYIEYGAQLTRLTGHTDVLRKAVEYREANGCRYEIWAGHLGRNVIEGAKSFTCPPELCRDSGSTMVAQALHEGRRRILVCGFDFGGYDVLSSKLQEQNKTNWVKRWREIARKYTLDRVEFIGYDHKPFIASGEKAAKYWQQYSRGRAHIDDPEYLALVEGLYGIEALRPREDKIVKVRYLRGPRAGWETEYKEAIALKLAERGEVEIIPEPEPEPEADDEPGTAENPPPEKLAKKRGRPRKKTIDDGSGNTDFIDDVMPEEEDA